MFVIVLFAATFAIVVSVFVAVHPHHAAATALAHATHHLLQADQGQKDWPGIGDDHGTQNAHRLEQKAQTDQRDE